MVSVLVPVQFSIVSLENCIQKVPPLTWKILQDIMPIFFSCNFSNFCCTHSRIRAPTRKPEVI